MPGSTSHKQRTTRHDLRALYETSQMLSSSLDLEFILNNLLLTAMSKLLVTRGVALLYKDAESCYHVLKVKGLPGLGAGEKVSLGELHSGELIGADDIPEELAQHQIVMLLPVAFGHRKIGLIGLGPKATGQGFDKEELEFILSLVNMSSASVLNSLMVEELQLTNRELDGKVQQLNTLFDLSQEFNSSVDRENLVKLLAFALMGQMLVNKHLFLLKRREEGDEDHEDVGSLQIVAAQGVQKTVCTPELLQNLLSLKKELQFNSEEECPAEWKPLCDAGLALVLPIQHNDETSAILCLGPKMTGQSYERGDIDLLNALGNLAFVSIQNTYLVEEQIEKERLQEEMRLARDIQERLLPSETPEVAGLEIASLALPSQHVGGDYFDLVAQQNGSILIAIADVTGKGVPAALLMANLQACLHTMVPMDLTMEEFIGHMNRVICQNTSYDKFITAFTGIYHPDSRQFQYVNAGHNPPMLLRKNGDLELLEEGGLLLGVMMDMPYKRGSVDLAPGDILVSFTDGVTEAMSPDEEEFHEDRLEAVIRAHQEGTAQEILDAVREAIVGFTGSDTQLSDDLTMIVMKVVD